VASQDIQLAINCVHQQLDLLKNGTITIATLQLLQANSDRFLALVKGCGKDEDEANHLMKLRNHELQAYLRTASQLDRLLDHCSTLLKTGTSSFPLHFGFEDIL
jgi:hypothetical protein